MNEPAVLVPAPYLPVGQLRPVKAPASFRSVASQPHAPAAWVARWAARTAVIARRSGLAGLVIFAPSRPSEPIVWTAALLSCCCGAHGRGVEGSVLAKCR